MNPNETLEARLERFWAEADEESETELSATLERILSEGAASPERALFERASLHDFLGQENAAIPLYRAALDSGLAPPHRTAAIIQLAIHCATSATPRRRSRYCAPSMRATRSSPPRRPFSPWRCTTTVHRRTP